MYEKAFIEKQLAELERIIEETDDIEAKYQYVYYWQFADNHENNQLIRQYLEQCIKQDCHKMMARYDLYLLLYDSKDDDEEMFRLLKDMIEDETMESMKGLIYNCMGDCYKQGRGVQTDYMMAYETYKKGMECSEFIENLISIGDLYYENRIDGNNTEAFACYARALKDSYLYPDVITNKESSRALALDRIGRCYMYGVGVETDFRKARDYLEESIDVFGNDYCDNRKDLLILEEKEKK